MYNANKNRTLALFILKFVEENHFTSLLFGKLCCFFIWNVAMNTVFYLLPSLNFMGELKLHFLEVPSLLHEF